jgi:hypothetical protein
MYINTANALNKLRDVLDQCESLYDVLYKYTGSDVTSNIINDLKCNDTLWDMADQNDMKESDMEEWVTTHLDSSASCRVFQEHGPSGVWPVVEVKCLDMIFYLDWIVE